MKINKSFGFIEHGSDYHFPELGKNDLKKDHNYNLFATGRDALGCLIEHGMKTRGWKRIWMPNYNCQHVVAAVSLIDIEIKLYDYSPIQDDDAIYKISFKKGDALLRINYFGLFDFKSNNELDRSIIDIIEDHSHDPWSNWAFKSDADWCVASLRKTMPVPDGGIVWSPKNHLLPEVPELTEFHYLAALEKYTAMLLKQKYLNGEQIPHSQFRNLFVKGEDNLFEGIYSGPSIWTKELLKNIPIETWRKRRKENFNFIVSILENRKEYSILKPENENLVPFSCILVFNSESLRDKVRKQLVDLKIFTTVLWPLEEPVVELVSEDHIHLSRKIMSIPIDNRYSIEHIKKVGYKILDTIQLL